MKNIMRKEKKQLINSKHVSLYDYQDMTYLTKQFLK